MSPQRNKSSRGYGDVSKYSSFELRFEDGPHKGRSFELPEGKTVIGRAEDCDVKIDSDAASRVHASVRRKGVNVFISDEGSHNGTFVNDEKITSKTLLSAGDKIHIGGMNLRLVIDGNDDRDASEDEDRSEGRGLSFGQKIAAFVVMLAIFTSVFLFLLPRLGLVPVLQSSMKKAESTLLSLVSVEEPQSQQASTPFALQGANSAQVVQPVQPAANPFQATPLVPPPNSNSDAVGSAPTKIASTSSKKRSNKRIRSESTSAADDAFDDDESEDEESDETDSSEGNSADSTPPTRDMRRVRSLYVAGKVGEAVELAEKIGLKTMVTQLRRFQKAESEAKSAFAYQRGTEAIQKYEEANAADRDILGDSQTSSVPGKQVRKSLSSLYQKAGEAISAKGNKERAAELFTKSLEYDSSNSRSRKLLNAIRTPTSKKRAPSDEDDEGADDFDESDEGDDSDEE